MIKKIQHLIEAVLVKSLFCFFKILPINVASCVSGFIGRSLGPHLKVNQVARKNILHALPELSEKEIDNIILKMWENLGRVVGEFPHMARFKGSNYSKIVDIEGADIIKKIGEGDKTTIFFSGHFSNWEIVPKTICEAGCQNTHLVYRKANNPYIDKLILDVRSNYQKGCMPKGSVGARYIIKAIKNGEHIGMLIDQKQNDGIAVPFFGRDAMTAPAIANLAIKFNCQLVPLEVIRVNGSRFKVKVYDPIILEKTGDIDKDIFNSMVKINLILEGWIRKNPEQWFWVHNRWPKL